MNADTALVLLGGLLLGVGLLGRVEVKEAVLGTESLAVRLSCGLLGLGFIGLAVQDRIRLPSSAGAFESEVAGYHQISSEAERAGDTKFFVVVSSTQSVEAALRRAKRLEAKGYQVGVYDSTTGYLAVAVRSGSRSEAEEARSDLLAAGLAASDSYVSTGKGFTGELLVSKGGSGPHNRAAAPDGSTAGDRQ